MRKKAFDEDQFKKRTDIFKAIKPGMLVFCDPASDEGENIIKEHGQLYKVKAVRGSNLITYSCSSFRRMSIKGPNDKNLTVIAVNTGDLIISSH